MIQKLIIIILTLSCNVAPLFAEDNFIVIDKGRTEFVVDLNSLDSCKPHTIEKYVRNSLYEDSERGYFLIKQQFEIGDGCFEGYHPQNIFISAYKLNNLVSGNLKAVWEFKSTGIKSEIGVYPFSSLFIIQEKGCCGGGDVNKNYSLNTGQLIAYSSKDILFVDLSSISEKRYIGVEDNVVPSQSLEGDHVAVIFYSNADYIIQQYLVTHPNDNEEWVLDRFEITENKIGTNPNNLTPKSKSAEYNLFISLWCRCEDPVVEFTIPILEEKLDINSASINGDSRVRIETINHKNSLQANVPSGP